MIKVKSVTKHFDDFKVLDNLSLNVPKGAIYGLVGPNGAGKSTTIKMLTGILEPSGGSIMVNGYSPSKQRKEYVKNIGVVFGNRSQLWWDLPALDSFELFKAIYKIPDKVYKENMSMFSEVLDLGNIMNKPVRQMSLGQRMRCEIAAHRFFVVFFLFFV
jgi:ABC-2 type transport system ATP-binding protein